MRILGVWCTYEYVMCRDDMPGSLYAICRPHRAFDGFRGWRMRSQAYRRRVHSSCRCRACGGEAKEK
ncbi:unnamed protein product [Rhodiola kirilowii]